MPGPAGEPEWADGTNALFNYPSGITIDNAGNLYVADTQNDTIRKMSLSGTNWTVMTIAGTVQTSGLVNGPGNSARFNNPSGITIDGGGNLYVADTSNNVIREISAAGIVTTVAGQAGTPGTNDGTAAQFNAPTGVVVNSTGTLLYVGDLGNDTIRALTLSGSTWSTATFAGLPTVAGDVNGTAPVPGSMPRRSGDGQFGEHLRGRLEERADSRNHPGRVCWHFCRLDRRSGRRRWPGQRRALQPADGRGGGQRRQCVYR